MWHGKSLSVVLPTYNEKDSIAETIRRFEKLGYVDDILVVNNNAAAGTSEEVRSTSAREVVERRQGYGAAIRRGLAEVDTDLVCICEPDGTFNPFDLDKLLPFTRECDFVVGSRTVSNFIWDGANMGWFLQFGNWTVAKLIEVLFNTTSLSDVGCTFRVLSKELTSDLQPRFKHNDSAFGLEMLLLAIVRRVRVVQIPVNYRPRVGESSVTGDFRKTLKLGGKMISMVLAAKLAQRRSMPVRYRRPSTEVARELSNGRDNAPDARGR